MDATFLEWVKTSAILFTAAGVWLAYRQFRASVRWNKVNAAFVYLDADALASQESGVNAQLRKHQIQLDITLGKSPIAESSAKLLISDPESLAAVKNLLNGLEAYATAINVGAADWECAYRLRVDRMLRIYTLLRPAILAMRAVQDNQMYYLELERLVDAWSPKREIERSTQLRTGNQPRY